MTEKEMASEQAAAREVALHASKRNVPKQDAALESEYLAELIQSRGWTKAELEQLGQEYDYESSKDR